MDLEALKTKMATEDDILKIVHCVLGIAEASEEVAQQLVQSLKPNMRDNLEKFVEMWRRKRVGRKI